MSRIRFKRALARGLIVAFLAANVPAFALTLAQGPHVPAADARFDPLFLAGDGHSTLALEAGLFFFLLGLLAFPATLAESSRAAQPSASERLRRAAGAFALVFGSELAMIFGFAFVSELCVGGWHHAFDSVCYLARLFARACSHARVSAESLSMPYPHSQFSSPDMPYIDCMATLTPQDLMLIASYFGVPVLLATWTRLAGVPWRLQALMGALGSLLVPVVLYLLSDVTAMTTVPRLASSSPWPCPRSTLWIEPTLLHRAPLLMGAFGALVPLIAGVCDRIGRSDGDEYPG